MLKVRKQHFAWKKGDTVTRIVRIYDGEINHYEFGIVKKTFLEKEITFVVYDCSGDWVKYMDYTAAATNNQELIPGWKKMHPDQDFSFCKNVEDIQLEQAFGPSEYKDIVQRKYNTHKKINYKL